MTSTEITANAAADSAPAGSALAALRRARVTHPRNTFEGYCRAREWQAACAANAETFARSLTCNHGGE